MEKYFDLLQNTPLFKGIDPTSLQTILHCLSKQAKSYTKGTTILMAGDTIQSIGILLEGNIQITREDILGNRTLLTELSPGNLFAESFVCAEIKKIPVTLIAVTGCKVLWIQFQQVLQSCTTGCPFHAMIIKNMIKLIAQKNIQLNTRIEILSKRSIREKLQAYLKTQIKPGQSKFHIPYNRNELADFLCVDRSALSRELCRMRDEGILQFHKNEFSLVDLKQL